MNNVKDLVQQIENIQKKIQRCRSFNSSRIYMHNRNEYMKQLRNMDSSEYERMYQQINHNPYA